MTTAMNIVPCMPVSRLSPGKIKNNFLNIHFVIKSLTLPFTTGLPVIHIPLGLSQRHINENTFHFPLESVFFQ
jgi:hypothetical protein